MQKKYDPLFNLYQIETEGALSNDKEVVGLMAEILYNIEDTIKIDKDVKKLSCTSERYLPLIKIMIDTLEAELSILGLMGFKMT